ncbi:lytic murein transglycosylase [Mesorhizobium sp. B2-4-19]|nr:lytic murein transglycosylase [Mesorhizobium sp. B2-4-19]
MPSQGTPLWPAGHLPLKGGDRISLLPSPIFSGEKGEPKPKLPISPLEGEMSGRTEGGLVEWQRIGVPRHDRGARP